MAYYGPTDQFASKVVVGITLDEKAKEVSVTRKWFATGVDGRRDLTIAQQIVEFLAQHHVERVALVDRIIGCPHEEGIDYPDGAACPQCPFWANRDRWTGKLIS